MLLDVQRGEGCTLMYRRTVDTVINQLVFLHISDLISGLDNSLPFFHCIYCLAHTRKNFKKQPKCLSDSVLNLQPSKTFSCSYS